MKVISSKEFNDITEYCIANRILDTNTFILNCARALEKNINEDKPEKVMIFCGEGRIGDIGLILASLLKNNHNTKVVVAHKGDRDLNLLRKNGIAVFSTDELVKKAAIECKYYVDCIFDSSVNGVHDYYTWIEIINANKTFVLAANIPSGVDGDNGEVEITAVKADKTIILQFPHMGLFVSPGKEYAGKMYIESVGLKMVEGLGKDIFTEHEISRKLPKRVANSHKGTYGKVLLAAGSTNTVGAGLMASKAVLKSGAGLLTLMSYSNVISALNTFLPEAMSYEVNEENFKERFEALDKSKYSVYVAGPGLGINDNTSWLITEMLKSDKPVIIDADGLNYVKDNIVLIRDRKALTVITPHVGEYQRIFNYDPATIERDLRVITTNCPNLVVVLKSDQTLIGYQGKVILNPHGNNALSKGGSGDVLCGMIAGFVAQKSDKDSVIVADYVHGLAADLWVKEHSHYSLLATELLDYCDRVLFELER